MNNRTTLYAIWDIIGQSIVGVFTQRADPAARRAFQEALQDQRTEMSRHPEDYELLALCTIEDDTAGRRPCVLYDLIVTTPDGPITNIERVPNRVISEGKTFVKGDTK